MRPLGLQIFGWNFNYIKIKGKWREIVADRLIKKPNRNIIKQKAIKDQYEY